MSSRPVSRADRQVIESGAVSGIAVSARQLERWRQAHAIPRTDRTFPGRGRGSTSAYTQAQIAYIVEFARRIGPKRRPSQVVVWMFLDSQDVSADLLRHALLHELNVLDTAILREARTDDILDAPDRIALKLNHSRTKAAQTRRKAGRTTFQQLREIDLLEQTEDPATGNITKPTFQHFEERRILNSLATIVTGELPDTDALNELIVDRRIHSTTDKTPSPPQPGFAEEFANILPKFSLNAIRRVAEEMPYSILAIVRDFQRLSRSIENSEFDVSAPPTEGTVPIFLGNVVLAHHTWSFDAGYELTYDNLIELVSSYERPAPRT